jgi:uncharacterized protein (DUF58 family)
MEIGKLIQDKIFQYEWRYKTEINKEHFYYAMAAMCIQQNDEVGAIIFWEMANVEVQKTSGKQSAGTAVLQMDNTDYSLPLISGHTLPRFQPKVYQLGAMVSGLFQCKVYHSR